MNALAFRLRDAPAIHIRQQKEWGEILTDWETKNRYVLSLPGGERFVAGELAGGLGAQLLRGFLKNRRPFTIEVRDAGGGLALRVERPWTWFFSRLDVYDGEGRPLGAVAQQLSLLNKRFRLSRFDGRVFAELTGPLFRPWTFELDKGGRPAGKIAKQWSGFFRELASDADDFGLEMGPGLDDTERLVTLGAVFLVDFLYFEDRG